MAIRKRQGQKPWQVYWNNPFTGKRECESFADKHEAEKKDSLIKHRLKFERESFRPAQEEQRDALTLEAVYTAYLREKQFSRRSLECQLDAMRLALTMLGQKPISEINQSDLESVLSAEAAKGVKPVTVRNRMRVLFTVMRYAYSHGYCSLPRFPKLPPAVYQRFIPPTPDEISAMLFVAPEHIQRVIIIGSQCGVRIGSSELFQLKWQDVDFGKRLLRVHGSHKNVNAPYREVPIREELIGIFRQWRETDATIGCDQIIHWQGNPVKSIKRSWATTLALAGIERRIRPYDLRHAFATELIAAGVDIGTTANLMGHSGASMLLKHYQYVMDSQKRKAVENLPHVPNPCAQKEKAVTNFS